MERSLNASTPNVNAQKNKNMNRSAILFEKLEQDLPKYVVGPRSSLSNSSNRPIKALCLKRSSTLSQSKTIKKILELESNQGQDNEESEWELKEVVRKKFPKEIINILYRQNVKGYNPYLVALKKLDEMSGLNRVEQERIKKLCYIGIAKNQLKNASSSNIAKYSRVGILIRPYMNPVMSTRLEEMRDYEPQTIYIKANQTALSFNPKRIPEALEERLSKRKYAQIIRGVNGIIDEEYKKYKMGSSVHIKNSITYSEIVTYTLICLILLIMVIFKQHSDSTSQYYFLAALLALIVVGSCMAWAECHRNIYKVSSSNNIAEKIQSQIKRYLESVSNDTLIWKAGPDFYWLEVHNIKVKKRKYQQNCDDF